MKSAITPYFHCQKTQRKSASNRGEPRLHSRPLPTIKTAIFAYMKASILEFDEDWGGGGNEVITEMHFAPSSSSLFLRCACPPKLWVSSWLCC